MAIRTGNTPSMIPDWGAFAAGALEDLRQGRVGCFINANEPPWFQGAYAWLYQRAPESAREGWPAPIVAPRGPPPRSVPVLAGCADGRGRLGFLTVEFQSVPPANPYNREQAAAVRAAEIAAAWYRNVTTSAHWPQVVYHLHDCEGESLALSAFAAALSSCLDQPVAGDVAFTGCLSGSEHQPIFAPADADYMAAKIAEARAWGYRRLLVIRGQAGIPDDALDMVHFLPEDPAEAAAEIFQIAMSDDAGAQAQARLLAVLDQALLRSGTLSPKRMAKLRQVTEPFVQEQCAVLPRRLAHDLRSRAFLHLGDTQAAADEAVLAQAAQPRPVDLRDALISNYVKYQERAHRSVLVVDQGHFEDGRQAHADLDAALERRLAALACNEADIVDVYMALIMANTRARRWMFHGRWERNGQRCAAAYQEFHRFADDWDELFDWCRHSGMPDGTLRRQENQCIEALADCAVFNGGLPAALRAQAMRLWPANVADGAVMDMRCCWDITAWIRWRAMLQLPISDAAAGRILIHSQREARRLGGGYPSFLPAEWLLRAGAAVGDNRRLAADALLASELFGPALKPTSVLTILAIRAEILLKQNGFAPPAPVRPAPGSKLAELGESLLASPEHAVARCPY